MRDLKKIKNTFSKKIQKALSFSIVVFLVSLVFAPLITRAAVPTRALGYQGQLFNSGVAVNGSVLATFTFYNALSGGGVEGTPINKTVSVVNGYFSTSFSEADTAGIDFSQSLWIEAEINGNTLTPRSAMNSVPVANNSFGVFSHSAAPTVGPAGSLYYNSASSSLFVSNGSTWVSAAGTSPWVTNGSDISFTTGSVGIGTTTPESKLTVIGDTTTYGRILSIGTASAAAQLYLSDDVNGYGGIDITSYGGGALSTPHSYINLIGSRGSTNSSTRVLVGDDLGTLNFYGQADSGLELGAGIGATAAADFTGSSAAADLYFVTNKNERMRVTSAGNVGIGTTTPFEKLTIAGSASGMFLESGAGRFASFVTGNTTGVLTVTAGTDNNATTSAFMINAKGFNNTVLTTRNLFGIQNNGTNVFTVTSGGNVGISTSSPLAKLSIVGEASTTGAAPLAIAAYGGSGGSGSAVGGGFLFVGGTGGSTNGPGGAFTVNGGAGNSAGGIGGAISLTGGVGGGSGAGGALILTGGSSTSGTGGAVTIAGGSPSSGTGGSIYIYGATPASGTAGNVILGLTSGLIHSGNVGVGTTSPSAKFTVVGTSSLSTIFDIASSSNASILRVTSTGNVGIGTTTPGSKLAITGSSGTNPFTVASSSGSQLFTISQNGNVGIGSASPLLNLHIQSSNARAAAYLRNTSSVGYSEVIFDNDTAFDATPTGSFVFGYGGTGTANPNEAYLYNRRNASMLFGTNNTTRMVLTGTGNVGVGTSSPTAKLHITGTAGTADVFNIASSTNTSMFVVKASGNVGIATSTPLYQLQVAGSFLAGSSTPLLFVDGANNKVYLGSTTSGLVASDFQINQYASNLTTRMHLQNGSNYFLMTVSSSSRESLLMSGFGGFKIQTNQIGDMPVLNLYANGSGSSYVRYSVTESDDWMMGTDASDGASFKLTHQAGDGSGYLNDSYGGSTYLTVKTDGKVGIGTIAPLNKFQVSGQSSTDGVAYMVNTGSGAGDEVLHLGIGAISADSTHSFVTFYEGSTASSKGSRIGSIQGTGASSVLYNTSSDGRLKENVIDTTLGLDDLMKIGVKDFNFKNSPGQKTNGFIAQDLALIYPYAVAKTDDGVSPLTPNAAAWGVDYGRLTPLIIKSVQDLNVKIDGLGDINAPLKDIDNEDTFVGKVFKRLTAWFADSTNGISKFFVHEVETTSLCVADADGTKTCITKSQLDALLRNASVISAPVESVPVPSPAPAPAPAPSSDSPEENGQDDEVTNLNSEPVLPNNDTVPTEQNIGTEPASPDVSTVEVPAAPTTPTE